MKKNINQSKQKLVINTFGNSLIIKYNDGKDFDENEEQAKKWGNHFSKNWINLISIKEKMSIRKYTRYSRNFNTFLRKYYDATNKKPNDMDQVSWDEIYKEINQDIKNIDAALRKSKLNEKIFVYRRVDLKQFYGNQEIINENLKLRNEEGKINYELVEKIKKEFINTNKGYLEPTFISTSLNRDPINDPSPSKIVFGWNAILLKIILPIGTHAAFIDEISHFPYQNEILIARNQLLQYKSAKIILDRHQRETLVVKTILIPN